MKALCVFSGGLDSMLAAGLIRAQGIDVLALFFETPFFASKRARESARSMDLPLKVLDISERLLEVVKHPKHGYGNNMNPCIDCHTLMFRVAGEMLENEEASFILTGEVLGQRPMSQNKGSLSLIARESGLGGLLLRPLSAKLLGPTIPEEEGWVKRELLMDFQGRSRKPQIELARRLTMENYPAPAGGCLLTDIAFSRRLKDLIGSRTNPELKEIELLKLGRHFRIGPRTKLVVGRNKKENEAIQVLSGDQDLVLTSMSFPGPAVLISGDLSDAYLELAANITAAYSDSDDSEAIGIKVTGKAGNRILQAKGHDKEGLKRYMV